MAELLVVDDSALARRQLGDILEAEESNHVHYAPSGQEALDMLAARPFDLVVTDMMMKGIDGLQLVEIMQVEYPRVPAVLVTSHGSEEVAVQALRKGAASYVPKRQARQELLDTVLGVLEIAGRHRERRELLRFLQQGEFQFVLLNDERYFRTLVAHLTESISGMGFFEESAVTRMGVALDEALSNALHHGNLEVSSELRDQDNGQPYYDLAKQRKTESPYQERRIFVSARLEPEKVEFVVRDEGPGFDHASLPDSATTLNLDKVYGRGVMLMSTFMDEVQFNTTGNQVTLTKRAVAPAS